MGGGKFVFQFNVMVKFALGHIDGNHLPRPQRTLFAHSGFVHWNHARLGPGDQQTIAGDHIAHGAQAVAIKTAADPLAIGHRQRCRAIPRLNDRIAIGIHIGPGRFHIGGGFAPRFGDQHGFGQRRVAARPHQHFKHRIQRTGIRRARRNDRLDVFGGIAKIVRRHAYFVGFHPVDVALQGVDLTVMSQHAEGLRQPPLRKSVGGIALMIDGKGRFEPVIHQVGVERRHLFGQHHAFVDDRPARQAAQIHALDLAGQSRLFDAASDNVKFPFKLFFGDRLFVADQNLLNFRPGGVGFVAQNRHIHRHMPPAIDIVAHSQNFGFHNGAHAFLRAEIGAGQENLTHCNQLFGIGFMAGAAHLIIKKPDRNLHMNARAITGFAISINSAPVPDGLERCDTIFNHAAAWFARNRHHQTHAARRMFVFGFVKTVGIHPRALGFLGGHPCGVVFGHGDILWRQRSSQQQVYWRIRVSCGTVSCDVTTSQSNIGWVAAKPFSPGRMNCTGEPSIGSQLVPSNHSELPE